MAVCAMLAVSCAKEHEPIPVPQPEAGTPVRLTFGVPGNFSRAFFDEAAAAEPWEKTIDNMTLYAINTHGKQVMRKEFGREEIGAMSAELLVPGVTMGEAVTFYVLANRASYPVLMTENDFHSVTDRDIYAYNGNNGAFEDISSRAMRPYGFAMSGKTTMTLIGDGRMNHVPITLKRLVAKIAVRIDIDPSYKQNYPGEIIVSGIDMTNKAIFTPWLFNGYRTRHTNPDASQTFQQKPVLIDGKYCAIFYTFEQGPPSFGPEDKAVLSIQTQYSPSGSFGSGNTVYRNYFHIPLEGSGDGEIRRNGYYRVKGTVADLYTFRTQSAVEVSEWEMPVTADLGNLTSGE